MNEGYLKIASFTQQEQLEIGIFLFVVAVIMWFMGAERSNGIVRMIYSIATVVGLVFMITGALPWLAAASALVFALIIGVFGGWIGRIFS